ncbi:MAG TPA: LytTR family DNA-binding domain-containing protein [Flavisolibacter sp.]
MLKALIVDDENACCEVLEFLLQKYCPDVSVVATCNSVAEALTALSTYKINLVFLDIEMPHANGFELLQKLPVIDFDLIFTTSYDQYAIKAIRFSALDYLLKPIDREELQVAVNKASERMHPPMQQQLQVLLHKMQKPVLGKQHIALPTMEGLQMVSLDSIISCSSKSNYTLLHFKDGQRLVVSKTLKEIELLLNGHQFLRVHHSHVVNLGEVKKYIRGEGGLLMMSNGATVDVSRSRKESVVKALHSF